MNKFRFQVQNKPVNKDEHSADGTKLPCLSWCKLFKYSIHLINRAAILIYSFPSQLNCVRATKYMEITLILIKSKNHITHMYASWLVKQSFKYCTEPFICILKKF